MAGHSTLLTKGFIASGAVPARSIVIFGAGDGLVAAAGAAADLSIGVSSELGALDGEPCDVHLAGVGEVVLSGAVARGERLTAGAGGTAAKGAAGNKIIGVALASGVAGDIIPMLISPSVI